MGKLLLNNNSHKLYSSITKIFMFSALHLNSLPAIFKKMPASCLIYELCIRKYVGGFAAKTCEKSGLNCIWELSLLMAVLFLTLNSLAWETITFNGFGNESNNGISGVVQAGSDLVVGTENFKTGCEVYKISGDGSWVKLSDAGFGEASNTRISSMIYFQNELYAGTMNTILGASLYRSADNGETWMKIDRATNIQENYRISSMAVFKNQLYLGIRNPLGAQIIRSSDGKSWIESKTRPFNDPHDIDIISFYAYEDRWLFAGVENADIMTGRTSGAKIYHSTNGESWEIGYDFNNSNSQTADISSFLFVPDGNYLLVGCRSLFPGKMDHGLFLKGQIGKDRIEFKKKTFNVSQIPGITCLELIKGSILAGSSNSILLELNNDAVLGEVILPQGVINSNGIISVLKYLSPYQYLGFIYPTFPVKGAVLLRTREFQTKEVNPVAENTNFKAPVPQNSQSDFSIGTLLVIGGIVLVLLFIVFLIPKDSGR
ncbi:MAG: hypothetical protein A2161_06080 [Candidatus Schekmanbacteria bacterium RBG_13_48_7]|uniref:Photosynthesis system II assembly factor Ycf48/Hcf136-like domain-containing protein n=1 Tax=Candidatus Schekmanbacteria bacterium RBG_13_48_7 TaxID=1817878 RepID=A0A1F7RMT8_9BACT|nr:MAG: hypothetical protein A2161_06080 [Candidatus Schekmanbacteria bacterium RBG_13_48_7]